MVHFKQYILSLVLVASSSSLGVVSFVPTSSPQVGLKQLHQQPSVSQKLNANANDTDNQSNRQVVGGATAFITGLVVATQVAFADPSTVVGKNKRTYMECDFSLFEHAYMQKEVPTKGRLQSINQNIYLLYSPWNRKRSETRIKYPCLHFFLYISFYIIFNELLNNQCSDSE